MRSVATARALRKRLTPQEARLWVRLRALRPQGLHFRRQVPLLGYVVDFACLDRRLIVEVDGSQHGREDYLARDAIRDGALAEADFQVLRIWNRRVNEDTGGVVDEIFRVAEARASTRRLKESRP